MAMMLHSELVTGAGSPPECRHCRLQNDARRRDFSVGLKLGARPRFSKHLFHSRQLFAFFVRLF